jgi:hypothetical protein
MMDDRHRFTLLHIGNWSHSKLYSAIVADGVAETISKCMVKVEVGCKQ